MGILFINRLFLIFRVHHVLMSCFFQDKTHYNIHNYTVGYRRMIRRLQYTPMSVTWRYDCIISEYSNTMLYYTKRYIIKMKEAEKTLLLSF
jgi:hypothetical protein